MTPLLDEDEAATTRSFDDEAEVPGRPAAAADGESKFLDDADQAHDEDSEEP